MPADLLAGLRGTEWNPKGPVALVTDYRCCSEGMWRDRMDPDGRPLGLLITQRSRVQIPPPPPLLSWGFARSPPLLARTFGPVVNGFVNGGVRDRLCGPRSVAPQDELRYRLGGGGVQAGEDVAVGVEREPDGRVAEPLADDLGRHARRQRRTCVAVADVVQSDLG